METGVLRQSYLSRPFLNTTQYHLYHKLFDLGIKTHTMLELHSLNSALCWVRNISSKTNIEFKCENFYHAFLYNYWIHSFFMFSQKYASTYLKYKFFYVLNSSYHLYMYHPRIQNSQYFIYLSIWLSILNDCCSPLLPKLNALLHRFPQLYKMHLI